MGGLQREAAAAEVLDSIPAQWNVLVPAAWDHCSLRLRVSVDGSSCCAVPSVQTHRSYFVASSAVPLYQLSFDWRFHGISFPIRLQFTDLFPIWKVGILWVTNNSGFYPA